MSKYLTWDCPKCGESLVRSVCIEETTAWLDPDGYAKDEEKLVDNRYKFLCEGCHAEIHHPDGSTFDEPSDIAEFFRGDEDVDRCDRL